MNESFSLSIPVYHVDNRQKNADLVNGRQIEASKEDGDWAGAGLYFWDNVGNADYWIKNRNENYTILKAWLTVPESLVLDLTEPNSVRNFESMAKMFFKYRFLITKNIDFNHRGSIVNSMYDILEKMEKSEYIKRSNKFNEYLKRKFSVVKIIGFYPCAPDTDFFLEKLPNKSILAPHATIKAKTIYAVRDQTLLHDRTIEFEA